MVQIIYSLSNNFTKKKVLGYKVNTISIAKKVLKLESAAILHLSTKIDVSFEQTVKMIYENKGRLVISGIGKSAIIGQKLTATLNSTGTHSLFLHAADACHGDIGMVHNNDILFVISQSGNTPEIKELANLIRKMGNKMIGMTGNLESHLANMSNFVINTKVESEADPFNLVPTTSTIAQMAMGDAIAVALIELRNFSTDDFAKSHPGGFLGKKLHLLAKDLVTIQSKVSVNKHDTFSKIAIEISNGRVGAVAVLENEKVIGIITDGDLRRAIESHSDLKNLLASEIMGSNPKTIQSNTLASEAFEMMKDNKISQLMVVENDFLLGFIHMHDLLREGFH